MGFPLSTHPRECEWRPRSGCGPRAISRPCGVAPWQPPLCVILEYRLPAAAPAHDVVDRPLDLNPNFPGHPRILRTQEYPPDRFPPRYLTFFYTIERCCLTPFAFSRSGVFTRVESSTRTWSTPKARLAHSVVEVAEEVSRQGLEASATGSAPHADRLVRRRRSSAMRAGPAVLIS